MTNYERLTQVFVVTAIWDVVLRLCATNKITLLGVNQWSWVHTLEPYFKRHTVLAAALIAGFVGAVAYIFIQAWSPPTLENPAMDVFVYLLWVAVVSAMIGIPMRYSGLFPHLKRYYYDQLPVTTIFTDALSGVIVACTLLSAAHLF